MRSHSFSSSVECANGAHCVDSKSIFKRVALTRGAPDVQMGDAVIVWRSEEAPAGRTLGFEHPSCQDDLSRPPSGQLVRSASPEAASRMH